jgi:hypothetical protein
MAGQDRDGTTQDSRDGGIVDGIEPSDGVNTPDDSSGLDPAANVTPKRGRGRPPKSGAASGPNGNASGTGAPAGAGKTSKASAPLDLDALAMQLVGVHAIAAKLLRAPELAIGLDEGKTLAKAIKQIASQYQVNISPKAMAFYQLIAACSVVYGPRAFMIANRKSQEAKAKKAVRPMPTVNPQGNGVPPVPGAFEEPPPVTGTMRFN